jgi:hypothetical protein
MVVLSRNPFVNEGFAISRSLRQALAIRLSQRLGDVIAPLPETRVLGPVSTLLRSDSKIG